MNCFIGNSNVSQSVQYTTRCDSSFFWRFLRWSSEQSAPIAHTSGAKIRTCKHAVVEAKALDTIMSVATAVSVMTVLNMTGFSAANPALANKLPLISG